MRSIAQSLFPELGLEFEGSVDDGQTPRIELATFRRFFFAPIDAAVNHVHLEGQLSGMQEFDRIRSVMPIV